MICHASGVVGRSKAWASTKTSVKAAAASAVIRWAGRIIPDPSPDYTIYLTLAGQLLQDTVNHILDKSNEYFSAENEGKRKARLVYLRKPKLERQIVCSKKD